MERTRGERREPAASDLEPFSLNIKYFGRYQRRDPPALNPRLFPSKVQGFFIRILFEHPEEAHVDPRRTCRLHTERLRLGFRPGTFVTPHCPATSDVPFGLESMTLSSSQNYTPQRMKPEHMLEYRNMLVWGFLLVISFQSIGATPEICKKEWPCADPVCFEIMGSPEPACTSTSHTHLCRIDSSCIEYNCDADLSCKCNGRPIDLADLTKCPVKDEESISMENEVHPEETKPYEGDLPEVPERNNTNRTESSGSSMTSLQIAAAVAVPAAFVVGAGAIAYCVWKPRRKQGHRDAEQEERDPQGQPLAQDQNIMELQDMNGDGEGEVV